MKKLLATLTALIISISTLGAVCAAGPLDDLLPKISEDSAYKTYLETAGIEQKTELKTFADLPNKTENQILVTVIKTILYLAGSLAVIGLLVVGAMFLTGSGNEESLTKARKILGYIGLGILVMSVAYAVITGILQIDLFSP